MSLSQWGCNLDYIWPYTLWKKGSLGFQASQIFRLANRAMISKYVFRRRNWPDKFICLDPYLPLTLTCIYKSRHFKTLIYKLFMEIIYCYWFFIWFCLIFQDLFNSYHIDMEFMTHRGSSFLSFLFYIENLNLITSSSILRQFIFLFHITFEIYRM